MFHSFLRAPVEPVCVAKGRQVFIWIRVPPLFTLSEHKRHAVLPRASQILTKVLQLALELLERCWVLAHLSVILDKLGQLEFFEFAQLRQLTTRHD